MPVIASARLDFSEDYELGYRMVTLLRLEREKLRQNVRGTLVLRPLLAWGMIKLAVRDTTKRVVRHGRDMILHTRTAERSRCA